MEIHSIIQTSRYIFMSTSPLTASKQSDLTVKTVQIRLYSLSIWLVHHKNTVLWMVNWDIDHIDPAFQSVLTLVAFYVEGSSHWYLIGCCVLRCRMKTNQRPRIVGRKKTVRFFFPKTLLGFVVFCNCHFNEIVLPENNKETSCPKLPGTKPVT